MLCPCVALAQGLADGVDTRVGTAKATTRTAGVFGQGTEEFAHTLPAVLVPYGMNFWTPETQATEKKGVCPYLYEDEGLRGFRCSHWIVGGCTQDYGSFTISPVKDAESLPYSHEQEVAKPYFYAVELRGDDGFGTTVTTSDGQSSRIKAEMTATERCGMLRFTFSDPDAAYLRVRVNSDEQMGEVWLDSLRGYIFGQNPCHRIYQGKGEPTGTSGWFCLAYDKPIESYGRLDKQTLWVKFRPTRELKVKAACSFTGYDGARKNLTTELPSWNFDSVKVALADIWERKLKQIEVSDCQEASTNRSIFYTALYHTAFLPHKINDVDGAYPRFASGEKTNDNHITDFHLQLSQYDYYDDFSLWDTYRAQHPLLALLEPRRDGQMMQSLVTKYQQGGWMPIFPCWNSYTAAMIGDHASAAIADAYAKGIRNFNVVQAYVGLRKNAFQSPSTYLEYSNGMGRRALQSYLEYGYIPLEDSVKEAYHQQEQTSRTMEFAYDDYALAQLARMMAENTFLTDEDLAQGQLTRQGLISDYQELMRRSGNWINVINPATKWAGGRKADGGFVGENDIQYIKEPAKHPESHLLTHTTFSTFITEGTPVHYTWYVPHDVEGLMKAVGGKKAMEARLDSMFHRGWYWHGNEPCHQIPYLYSAMGLQNKTVDAVHHILETEYLDAPGGLSGNDDAGQMSAWYIFSAMGFYPLCPSTPYYYLGAPLFPKIVLHLDNDRTFTILAPGLEEGKRHIKAVRLNGKKLSQTRISHFDLMAGGTLEFELSF